MRIWTVGHSTLAADEFLALLRAHEISGLADVRAFPNSRRHPQFGQEQLRSFLHGEGIDYRHFRALGGFRKPRPDSINTGWTNASFRGYADYMETAPFADAIDRLLEFGRRGRAAVMCAEAVWWRCHRMLIADALLVRDVEVVHILATGARPHALTTGAQPEGRRIRYRALHETKADHPESN